MDDKVDQPPRGTSVPRQLPSMPAHFTRREPELKELDSAADQVPAVTVVFGPGGVGKTAVVVTWAARNAERFPDGQLYMDLRGFSPGTAVVAEEALGSFLRALGVAPERVPVELSELAALFRTTTADSRLLLVVDNARSAAQVRPLIPASAKSMVVVTTRLRLDGLHADGARFVDMAPLKQDEAVELLERAVSRPVGTDELPDLRTLAALCGCLPIALRVVGARLAARPRWPVARMVAELRDESARLGRLSSVGETSLTAVFDASYAALSADAAKLYRLIGEHPGSDVEVGVAAAAARVSDVAAAEGLQALADASLLEEVSANRYRFHGLVKLHARAQQDDERFEVVGRIANWYLHQMTRANMVVIPIRWRVSTVCERYKDSPAAFDGAADALEWLETRLQDIGAVLEELAEQHADEVAWQLCEALWELFLHRKHFQWWLQTHALGIAAAHRCSNKEAEARLQCQLGRAYLDLGHFDAAEQECETARDLARDAGSRRVESVALEQLGMAAQGRGEVDRAIACFGDSLRIEQELGIDRGVAQRHRRIGDTLLQAGRREDAKRHLSAAREMFADMGDRPGEATVEIGLARIEAQAGETAAALRRLELASAVLSESRTPGYKAEVLMAFAEVTEVAGDLGAARAYACQAIELSRPSGGLRLDRAEAQLAALEAAEPDRL